MAQNNPNAIIFTNTPTQVSSQCWIVYGDHRGRGLYGIYNGASSNTLPTTRSQYALGCILVDISAKTTGVSFRNTGTDSIPTWSAVTQ